MRYYRTLVTIEILGNEPYQGDTEDIHAAITDGDFSGAEIMRTVHECDAEKMTERLIAQGSDPSFLNA